MTFGTFSRQVGCLFVLKIFLLLICEFLQEIGVTRESDRYDRRRLSGLVSQVCVRLCVCLPRFYSVRLVKKVSVRQGLYYFLGQGVSKFWRAFICSSFF